MLDRDFLSKAIFVYYGLSLTVLDSYLAVAHVQFELDMEPNLKIATAGVRPAEGDLSIRKEFRELIERKLQTSNEIMQRLLAEKDASNATAIAVAKDVLRMALEIRELCSWAYPSREPISAPEAVARTPIFREQGFDEDTVKQMVGALQKSPEGKKQTVRASHIQAFEFMLQSKSNSLGIAINHFCKCGQIHNKKCRSSFRYGIQELKKILRKHLPHLVVRYDALHPDRNSKRS